jgi:hypothetical protein
MNEIQAKAGYKTQRKPRTRAVALAQIAASKIPRSKRSEHSHFRSFSPRPLAGSNGGRRSE